MLTVETLGKIRRDHFVHGKSIKAIARARGVSRNTVRKALRSEDTAFRYERQSVNRPKLGPFLPRLESLLAENATKGRRKRLTLTRLFEQLRSEGYEGSYDAIRRYPRQWRQRQRSGAADAYRTADLVRDGWPPRWIPLSSTKPESARLPAVRVISCLM